MTDPLRELCTLSDEAKRLTQAHPRGTPCRYWTGKREGPGIESRIRTAYSVLSGHTIVVWVDGSAGCVAATHVEPITTPKEE